MICPECKEKASRQYAYMTKCHVEGTAYDHDLYALPPHFTKCGDCGEVEKNHHERYRLFYCVNEKCDNLNQLIYRKPDRKYSWDYKGTHEKMEEMS